MKILITGAKGFVGKNFIAELKNIQCGNRKYPPCLQDVEIYEYDIDTPDECLAEYTKDCDFVCHFAGVNRPEKEEDFVKGNYDFTKELLENLKKNNNCLKIIYMHA